METNQTAKNALKRGPLAALVAVATMLVSPIQAGPFYSKFKNAIVHDGQGLEGSASGIPLDLMPGSDTATRLIEEPGTYYLTEDILCEPGKHCVEIRSERVVLNLNHHTIHGVPGSLSGVFSWGNNDVTVRNGHILDCPEHGVALRFSADVHVASITVSGCGGVGILLDRSTGSVVDSVASRNLVGIQLGGGLILGCVARGSSSSGIQIEDGGGLVRQTDSYNNGGAGLSQLFGSGWTVAESNFRSNGQHGISVCAQNYIRDNFALANEFAGIQLRCGDNVVVRNTVLGNGVGIESLEGSDTVIDNFGQVGP